MANINEIKTSATYPMNRTVICIHPNPVTDYIHITGIEDTALITISDLHCRVLLSKRITENEKISISALPKGVYIAKISTANFTVEKKLEKKL